jgi:hypothetical protein
MSKNRTTYLHKVYSHYYYYYYIIIIYVYSQKDGGELKFYMRFKIYLQQE